MGLFDVDKSQLLQDVLRRHGVKHGVRQGWQAVSCPLKHRHSHGDANKSASVNISTGYLNCHGCGFTGDGFDIMLELEGTNAEEVRSLFGSATQPAIGSSDVAFTFAKRDGTAREG